MLNSSAKRSWPSETSQNRAVQPATLCVLLMDGLRVAVLCELHMPLYNIPWNQATQFSTQSCNPSSVAHMSVCVFGCVWLCLCVYVHQQVGCPDKAREAPLALKALYDEDLAEEDIILAWHGKEDAAKVCGGGAACCCCCVVEGSVLLKGVCGEVVIGRQLRVDGLVGGRFDTS